MRIWRRRRGRWGGCWRRRGAGAISTDARSCRATAIVAKVTAYGRTGDGKVKVLKGISGKRLRVGGFRVIFEESESEIIVTEIGPRGSVYD